MPPAPDDDGLRARRAAARAADRACALPTVGGQARLGVHERGAW